VVPVARAGRTAQRGERTVRQGARGAHRVSVADRHPAAIAGHNRPGMTVDRRRRTVARTRGVRTGVVRDLRGHGRRVRSRADPASGRTVPDRVGQWVARTAPDRVGRRVAYTAPDRVGRRVVRPMRAGNHPGAGIRRTDHRPGPTHPVPRIVRPRCHRPRS
jgi:hypothetical protein